MMLMMLMMAFIVASDITFESYWMKGSFIVRERASGLKLAGDGDGERLRSG